MHRMVTARWLVETLATQRDALGRAVRVRLLVIVGEGDRMVSHDAIEVFYIQSGSERRDLKVYRGFYHEPLNEVGRERVWSDILDWLESL